MPHIEQEKVIQVPLHIMYDIVADFMSYPNFLPWCKSANLIEKGFENDTEFFIADLTIGYNLIQETFRTKVYLHKKDNLIKIKYIKGPFKHLMASWEFKPISEKTVYVLFKMSFEFSIPLLKQILSSFFKTAMDKMVSAFEQRALSIQKQV